MSGRSTTVNQSGQTGPTVGIEWEMYLRSAVNTRKTTKYILVNTDRMPTAEADAWKTKKLISGQINQLK